ncbi:MAG: DUF4423 domain-containing protein [Alphaproteobacteria bacterium]|nr:DUF4423 domain-containing protein [Alphaproteobacteria bacterium]
MHEAARQILRALRGPRSQVAFSRRLGYRSNVAADWESGRRFPTGGETLRAADRVGIDVVAALHRFQPMDPLPWSADEPEEVAAWLTALQGAASQLDLASRSGFSRHQVGRWLSGKARPRLPELLTFVDAMTGRAADLVAALVPIEQVPAMLPAFRRARVTRRLAYDLPWTAAVVTLLETADVPARDPVPAIAQRLRVPPRLVTDALDALRDAGVVEQDAAGWHVVGPLTVDVHASVDDMRELKRHWARVASGRLDQPGPQDLHSFNLFAVSRADMERIRAAQQAFFRQVRSIVASSSPSEAMGLLVAELVVFDDDA